MRRIIYLLLIAFSPLLAIGQVVEKQTNEGNRSADSIPSLIPVDRQTLLKNVDVIFNSRFAYDSHFNDIQTDPNDNKGHDYSSFNINQLRLEVKGKISDKVYFRFRNRFTKEPDVGSIDHMSQATDLAFARFDVSKKTNFSFGKLCADWGGYEFDFNPIDILQYNDFIDFADNFLVGAGVSHTLNAKHSLSFQVLNSRTKTFTDQYGSTAPPDIKASPYPLALVGNWRGSFFKGKFETTWSYSFFNEAEGHHMNYIALGNKFAPNKNFVLYYDIQYSNEGLDRTSIVSSIINNSPSQPYAATGAVYFENWIRAEYLVAPKVNLLLTLMNSSHSWDDNPNKSAPSLLSTSYGAIPTVQYLPFKNMNLKFYLSYVYRRYDFSDYAVSQFGQHDYTTGRLSFGLICPFLVL